MPLDTETLEQIVGLLKPLMQTENDQRALLSLAFPGHNLLDRIAFGGPVNTFIPNMVTVLTNYGEATPGKHALWKLLEVVRSWASADDQRVIDGLGVIISTLDKGAFKVPYVIAAMTGDEAAALGASGVFVPARVAADHPFWGRYAPERKDWQPFVPGGSTVSALLQALCRSLSDEPAVALKRKFEFIDYSESFFAGDMQIWDYLHATYGILLIDIVSTLDAGILKSLQDSGLFSDNKWHVAAFSPFPSPLHATRVWLDDKHWTRENFQWVFFRRETRSGYYFETPVEDQTGLLLWLWTALQRISWLAQATPPREAVALPGVLGGIEERF
ncbi:MAG: hypothetical protein JXB47_12020 [Anaerolineae bacterium]|nr:hypothetical protein [Anaerolineae bacterium]